jgi:CheY-like chemotaxis protein
MANPISPEEYSSKVDKWDDLQAMFIRNVEHELRTPVTVIQGFAELLSEGSLEDSEQQQAIFAITRKAGELHTLVERITTLVAAQRQPAVHQVTDLKVTAEAVLAKRRARAEQANITLTLDVSSASTLVTAHSYQLQQAIDCLVDNALKFTPAGGRVEVRVDVKPNWVCLSVIDTGVGIAPAEVERIFNSFYQIDGSTTRRYGGLGLGLAVAKAVIEAYNGQIEVQSQPNQGSHFTIKLPILSPETEIAGGDAMLNQATQGRIRPQRILVVDDEEFVTLTLQEGLKKLPNCEVVTAANGQQALQRIEESPFDLVFTDYKMPDMDGLTLSRRIQQLCPQAVIIMITAYSDDELHRQVNQSSVQRILTKPVEFSDIRRVVSETLSNTGLPDNQV